jgi:radical SAM superfamily enzyme YgiQ (UPF0313 family)
MRRLNVLLVNPRVCKPANARLPLSLLALGAVLEGRHDHEIVDGNMNQEARATVSSRLARGHVDLVGMTVMPGPQVVTAVALASAIRDAHPSIPIAWGGYFPSLYPDAAINARYVDYVVRGPGEETLVELLDRLPDAGAPTSVTSGRAEVLAGVRGLTWKQDGRIVHNAERRPVGPDSLPPLVYERVGNVAQYLLPTYMGARTAVHQAALGCRYHCTFCGVVSMFNGRTWLEGPERLRRHLEALRDRHGATAVQFYDNNFFDTEANSLPALDVLASVGLPYWCYARTDTLATFSAGTWRLVRRSGLKMVYLGAEAASDEALRAMRKGTRVEHTMEALARCREHGVIPELSFILGGPDDPEGDAERTMEFVRRIKTRYPESEIILYFYTPTPQRNHAAWRADPDGLHLPEQERYGPGGPPMPATPEEWTEQQWVDFVCHTDAPWLTPRMRQRVRGFARVLACRFPTVQDVRTPRWGRAILRDMARWRYATRRYERPLELDLARRIIPLKAPQAEGL